MPQKRLLSLLSFLVSMLFTLSVSSRVEAAKPTESVLYSFLGGTDGSYPWAGVVFDSQGNLFGMTRTGGTTDCGTIYELTPNGSGGWNESVIWNFDNNVDGCQPYGTLLIDNLGNLYGTTSSSAGLTFGTAFELSPSGTGTWNETILHTFGSVPNDALVPQSNLISDSSGNLYGTTRAGGGTTGCESGIGCGTVFKLQPSGSGWTEKILYRFKGGTDGDGPWAGLVFDGSGNLYGTTLYGGRTGTGTVFEITTAGKKMTLHSFGATTHDAGGPFAGLVFDGTGNLYGTTYGEGSCNGIVYELTPGSTGWSEKILHQFTGASDGCQTYASVTFDSAGNLYGTTNAGGGTANAGTVFELIPGSMGRWNLRTLYTFQGGMDGLDITSGVVLDSAGNLYGASMGGGTAGFGTVFEVKLQ